MPREISSYVKEYEGADPGKAWQEMAEGFRLGIKLIGTTGPIQSSETLREMLAVAARQIESGKSVLYGIQRLAEEKERYNKELLEERLAASGSDGVLNLVGTEK